MSTLTGIGRGLSSIALVALLVATAAVAEAGIKDEFKCEEANQKELTKASADRGKCITKCVAKRAKGVAGRVCTPPFDPVTQSCVDKAGGKYVFKAAAKCKTPKLDKIRMPRCGSYAPYYPSVLDFANAQLASNAPFVDDITEGSFICDQTDPPTDTSYVSQKDALKCQFGVVDALGKLARGVSKCLGKCYKQKQVKGDSIGCDPTNLGTLDAQTSGCLVNERTKAAAKMVAKCAPCNVDTDNCLPNCGLYPGFGLRPDIAVDFVTDQQYPPFKEDNPDDDAAVGLIDGSTNPFCAPRVCGDGTTAAPVGSGTQDEQCDPGFGGTCQAPSSNAGADCVNDDDCIGGACGAYAVDPDDSACPGQCAADCLCP